jgi:hypothetical protein
MIPRNLYSSKSKIQDLYVPVLHQVVVETLLPQDFSDTLT